MKKELMPGLFSDQNEPMLAGHKFVTDISSLELSSVGPAADVKRLEKRVDGLTTETKNHFIEMSKQTQSKFEVTHQKLTALDSKFEALAADLRSKYSSLSGKVTERNLVDMKTQALVDRHTQIMRQFEQRVSQLQKVIEEQEFMLMNYRGYLDEAKKEIARLKRL